MSTYGETAAAARVALGQARLNDSDEHFPYRLADARALMAENPAMGPDGDNDDGTVRAQDYLSDLIVTRSDRMIQAQAAYLASPDDADALAEFEFHKQLLVEARQAHRANRPVGGNVVGLRARRAGE